MLEIKDLVKNYGKFTAVDRLTLSVGKGAICGFVGPNGAGKTTTMRIMSGLLNATSGNVIIDGVDVTKNPRALREKIGYMPDFFGVYDNLKVTEYMDFYAGAYGIAYKDRAPIIDNLLEIVDLSHKKDSYVDSLSRGMKQRLCLARSLVHDPELLILDEPASGLDPRARVEMKEVLKQLQEMGKTIIISSHILPELAEMCTEVCIINHGKLAAQGSVQEIMQKLSQKRIIHIEPLREMERMIQILKEQPMIRSIVENTKDVELDFTGTNEELSDVLKQLILADIPLLSFKEKEGNLEEVFMQVTGGESI
ncbi:ABC transporter ATP-binding protein [Anaerotignum propionicum]|uniref:ABC transporter ATP-binding protein YbhF n=1 Tax=Anaerotignum propionicum DSM 1682 TaxID=991789 RepID=A0A0X8V8N1_ANAPI|nr:ABC transporter ATP-binding protein [Anaerotignum propionicum]AMJ40102.1 putative ABC transporter ATP-binding protein YbhF [Anaerotignum propionicum DSM 1682]MEA5056258.1 ABC transporter ATP-binding protein [Anaerotignum propionicum]SHE80755.1 ABC-2 type transport system ATP-binding protein [[Clostridium] propionicum DSM 1682] [Anaerotignum propionicum DSM 1682]